MGICWKLIELFPDPFPEAAAAAAPSVESVVTAVTPLVGRVVTVPELNVCPLMLLGALLGLLLVSAA